MIYCGKKTDLYNFKRTYLPKDLIIEFKDDGSDRTVRMKTGRENYSAPYPDLPYLSCDCKCSNKYVFNTQQKKDKWIIKHNMKGYPIIQLYSDTQQTITEYVNVTDENGEITPEMVPVTKKIEHDQLINGEIHYIDLDTIEVTFSEPVSGYAICLLLKDGGLIYKGSGSEWLIQHNLQDKPFTQVFDMSGYQVNCEVEHLDDNTTRIRFFSGRDYTVKEDADGKQKVILGEKTPYEFQGYAVLISEPSAHYIHEQTEPSMEWEIRHGLNNFCLIQLTDPDLYVKLTEVRQINKSIIRASFSEPVSGRATCVTYYSNTSTGKAENAGGVIVVDQYELPDVAEAMTNTIYVIKETGYAYVTNDNFQWIAITPGPVRIDGNQFSDEEGKEIDGSKWDNHTWEE